MAVENYPALSDKKPPLVENAISPWGQSWENPFPRLSPWRN